MTYVIPNAGVDLSTLTVRVQDTTSTAGYVVFNRSEDLTLVKPDDTVYFIKEIDNELYEVYFGDGITGRAVVPGNVVVLDYFVSNKEAPNNAKAFSFINAATSLIFFLEVNFLLSLISTPTNLVRSLGKTTHAI